MSKIVTAGVIGTGFVGGAMVSSFKKLNVDLKPYDKYSPGEYELNDLLIQDILFLCLPTHYNQQQKAYDKSAIEETCKYLEKNNYHGGVIIKSTVEPGTTQSLNDKFPGLNIIHNPEFLTARTAKEDYHNQKHIVLGRTTNCCDQVYNNAINFHLHYYPRARVSKCSTLESESVKAFANSFYSVKVQFFTELYLLCQKTGCDYNTVKDILIRNDWINPMHTNVPGPDGEISYGGLCFPKDTNALNEFMKLHGVPSAVLQACIDERDTMRSDHDNCD